MFKLFKRSLSVYVDLCILVGTLVIGASVGWVGSQTIGFVLFSERMQIVGNPPTPEFVEWVNTLPKTSYSGKVHWTGKVVITSDDTGFASSDVGYRCGLTGCEVQIHSVTISDQDSEEDAKWLVRAETVGRYSVFDWLLSHPDYLSWDDPDTVSWMDGMGYMTVWFEKYPKFQAQYMTNLAYQPLSWDGYSQPTCEHLLAIQALYQTDKVMGTGIEHLLTREGCE